MDEASTFQDSIEDGSGKKWGVRWLSEYSLPRPTVPIGRVALIAFFAMQVGVDPGRSIYPSKSFTMLSHSASRCSAIFLPSSH
jgi:hypothetical protein